MDAILPLKKILADAKVGTESAFKNHLSKDYSQDDFIAPATFWSLLKQFSIFRYDPDMYYAVVDGVPALSWWIDDLAVYGTQEDIQEILKKTMNELGFKARKSDPNARDEATFYREQKDLEEEVTIRGPHRWTGAEKPTCGLKISWVIRACVKAEMPLLNALLSAVPMFRDERVDPRVYEDLGTSTIQSLLIGRGIWEITLAPANAAEMYQHFEQLLKDLGYAPDKVKERVATWFFKKTSSYAYLSKPDEKGQIHFRLQPRSYPWWDSIVGLKNLLTDAKVSTDSTFKDFLSSHSHREDLVAPATLREVLTKFTVKRVEFGLTYAVEDGLPTLTCWMGELGVRGRVEVVQQILNKAMRDLGFEEGNQDPKAEDTVIFIRTKGNVVEEASFRGPHRWTGTKEASCGFQVYWKVQGRACAETPKLDALLTALPILRDDRVDPLVYADLGPSIVQAVAVGGTWTRYYDWDVTLAPGKANEKYQHLEQLLKDVGYVPGTVSGDLATWERQKTGSFAYLTRPDEKCRVNFRIQSES